MKVVLNLQAAGWLGGRYYLENLALALAALPPAERPDVVALAAGGEAQIGGIAYTAEAIPADATVVFPNWGLRGRSRVPEMHWIPDLQHRVLPRYFGRRDRIRRDVGYRRLARRTRCVVVSSEAVREAAARAYPRAAPKLRTLHFRSVLQPELTARDPAETVQRLGVPDEFLLIANQFWTHKNHAAAFAAAAELPLPLVCTGSTDDPRSPGHFAGLVRSLEQRGLRDRVHILGVVPRSDYVQLVRAAQAVVQPSLSEGWSSIVEDARALGKRIALSDIPVHREQDPPSSAYFAPLDPAALAAAVDTVLELDPVGEGAALAAQRALVTEYARRFVALVRECAGTM